MDHGGRCLSEDPRACVYGCGKRHQVGDQRSFSDTSRGNAKSIGVSFGYPYVHYNIMDGANTFVNAYSNSREQMEAFVEALYGEIPMAGVSPVYLEPGLLKDCSGQPRT